MIVHDPWKCRRWLTLCVPLVMLASVVGAKPSVNVALQHWVYTYLERFEALGVLTGLRDGIKPLSRGEVVCALNDINVTNANLSKIDRAQLMQLRSEFGSTTTLPSSVEVEVADFRRKFGQSRPLLHYRWETGDVYADFLVRHQGDFFRGRWREGIEKIWRNRAGGDLRGHLGEHLAFHTSFLQTREQGTRTYATRDDIFENRLEIPQLKSRLADFHEAKAYLVFKLPFASVEVGKDEAAWGPAPAQNLVFSGNASSFNMLRLRSDLGVFKFVSINGRLRPCPDRGDAPGCVGLADERTSYWPNGVPRILERQKNIAAHRLEVAIAPWLDVGFYEVVVYGDRGQEWSYLNPLMFYWAAQSYLGDKDNLIMGVDLDVRPARGWRWYLSYIADDLKKLRVFSDDFANKFSLQSGLLWVEPLGWRDTDLRAEYVRIEPWIYTHKIPINTFRHFDSPLGHEIGPNSDRWWLRLTQRWTRDLALEFGWSWLRHGDNILLSDDNVVNVGGDLHRGWRPNDNRRTKSFLDGNVGRVARLDNRLIWRPLPNVELLASCAYEWGRNVPLPPRWQPNIVLGQRTGYGDGNQLHVSFSLSYGRF